MLLYRRVVSIKEVFLLFAGVCTAILASYARFFLLGHTFGDFISVQKYIASFYLSSQLEPVILSVWKTVALGLYQPVHGGKLLQTAEWSPLWPILTLITLYLLLKARKNPLIISILAAFSISALIVYSFIPFYARYFILILPFLYLNGVYFIRNYIKDNYAKTIILSILFLSLFRAIGFLFPPPDDQLNSFYYNISHKFFHDIYEENIHKSVVPLSRYHFNRIGLKAFYEGQIEKVEVSELKRTKVNNDEYKIDLGFTYHTRALGSFFEKKDLTIKRMHNRWKIEWKWDFIVDGYKPGYQLENKIELGKRGSIVNSIGKTVAEDTMGDLISIDLDTFEWKKEDEIINKISTYVVKKPIEIKHAYLINPLIGYPIDIGTTFVPLTSQQRDELHSYPGVLLRPLPARHYYGLDPASVTNTLYDECCTRIYNSSTYDGIFGPEKEYNNTLDGNNGGTLNLVSKEGTVIRTLIDIKPTEGERVSLP